jgi:8-oxo-dGTP pyrophosphatase MutT (NUDIX family)
MDVAPKAIPRAAATVLLLRDGAAGIEVLMITRHADVAFAGGALVFPGGRIDETDASEPVLRHCAPVPGADTAAMASRVAGIRETYEEAHILLARPVGQEMLLGAASLERLEGGGGVVRDFAGLVAGGGIELATDLMVPYAHWITPADQPKRFDTLFYLAPAPVDQVAAHDGREAVESVWMSPEKAIAESDAKRVSLMFATRLNLQKLGRSRTVAEALAAARTDKIVTVCPEIADTPSGKMFRIPADAGYAVHELPVAGMPRANKQQ